MLTEQECRCHPKPVCPVCPPTCKGKMFDFYAQYGVNANPSSGSYLPLLSIFQNGNEIQLENETSIALSPGYIYRIDYVFSAVTEANSYMQIVPYINQSPAFSYSYFAPSGIERNTSASAGFIINAAAEETASVQFRLTYPEVVRNIDISGAVSITPAAIYRG